MLNDGQFLVEMLCYNGGGGGQWLAVRNFTFNGLKADCWHSACLETNLNTILPVLIDRFPNLERVTLRNAVCGVVWMLCCTYSRLPFTMVLAAWTDERGYYLPAGLNSTPDGALPR